MNNVLTGSFTATGQSAGIEVSGYYNIELSGTFVGTSRLERSFDGGVTWAPLSKDSAGTANSFTSAISMTVFEPESGNGYAERPNVQVRWNCTAYTSGTISYRVSQ